PNAYTLSLHDALPISNQNQQANLQQPQRPFANRQPVDQPAFRHQPNPYANVPSLYDLYQQVSRPSTALERFGESVFANANGNMRSEEHTSELQSRSDL